MQSPFASGSKPVSVELVLFFKHLKTVHSLLDQPFHCILCRFDFLLLWCISLHLIFFSAYWHSWFGVWTAGNGSDCGSLCSTEMHNKYFSQAGCPSCSVTNSVKALKALLVNAVSHWFFQHFKPSLHADSDVKTYCCNRLTVLSTNILCRFSVVFHWKSA